jgi:hypothetical protein
MEAEKDRPVMTDDGSQADRKLLTGIQSQPPGYQYHQHALEEIEETHYQAEPAGSRSPQVAAPHLGGTLFPEVYAARPGSQVRGRHRTEEIRAYY